MNSDKSRFDYTLLWLTAGMLVVNIPLFINKIWPFVDTFFIFQQFYVNYNEFFFRKEFTQWLPFAFYGIQNDLYLISILSPSNYFVGLIGWIFRVENVYLLFKLSVVLEEFLFLAGTYLLAKTLFKHRTTILFVCISVIGSVAILDNAYFSFRIYYLLPFVFYFLILFFSRYKLYYLTMAMTVFVIQCIGLVPYMVVIPFLVVLIFFIVLLLGNYKNWHKFLNPPKRDAILAFCVLLLFFLITGAYLYFVSHILDFITLISPGRDAGTGYVDIDTFLTYGGHTDFKKFVDIIFPSHTIRQLTFVSGNNVSLFSGVATLFFIFYLIIKRRTNPFILALIIVSLVLAMFSVGGKGFVASILYQIFPPMHYYRHIGYVVNIFKLLFPLLAGYGLELFLDRNLEKVNSGGKTLSIYTPVALSIVAYGIYISVYLYSSSKWLEEGMYSPIYSNLFLAYSILIYTGIVVFGLFLFFRWGVKSPGSLLLKAPVVIIIFEMLTLQFLINSAYYPLSETISLEVKEEVLRVNKYRFDNNIRATYPPKGKRAANAIYFLVNAHPTPDAVMLNFSYWSPCYYNTRIYLDNYIWALKRRTDIVPSRFDMYNTNVYKLITLTTGNVNNFYDGSCANPKLSLMSDILFVDGLEDAVKAVRNTRMLKDILILNDVPKYLRESWEKEQDKTASGRITVTDFRANGLDLEVELQEESSSWLFYTDAWHPMWKAYVNGKPTHVAQAQVAFKAIKLNGGLNKVRLVYDNEYTRYCVYIFAIVGIGFVLAVLTVFVRRKDKASTWR